jgi:hypothetical protein
MLTKLAVDGISIRRYIFTVQRTEVEYLRLKSIGLAPTRSNIVRITGFISYCCHTNLVKL